MLGAEEGLALGTAGAEDATSDVVEVELLPHPATARAAAIPSVKVPRILFLKVSAMS